MFHALFCVIVTVNAEELIMLKFGIFVWVSKHMRHVMRKPAFCIWEDSSILYFLSVLYFLSDLIRNPKDRFSHDAAHMIQVFIWANYSESCFCFLPTQEKTDSTRILSVDSLIKAVSFQQIYCYFACQL